MRETEFSAEEKYQLYQRLMMAIFGVTSDTRLPICYPYIIEDGEKLSLEKGVKKVLETLRDYSLSWPRKRQIQLLNLRFGLEDGKTRTLKEAGEEFNKTKERIRQVETRIFRVLRHPSRSKFLVKFLLPTPEQEAENLRRFKELEEKKEGLETTIQTLGEEIRNVREENQRLCEFLNRFGLSPEELNPERIERTRIELRNALCKVASLYPEITNNLVTNAYNALVRSGINSLSQLRAIMALKETKITSLRQIGEKSFWLIRKVIERIEEETNEQGAQ